MLSSTFVATKAGHSKPVRLTAVIAALFLLVGCASPVPQMPSVNIQDKANADYYLLQLQQSSDDNKDDLQLLAIRALLREGKLPQVSELWEQLPKNTQQCAIGGTTTADR